MMKHISFVILTLLALLPARLVLGQEVAVSAAPEDSAAVTDVTDSLASLTLPYPQILMDMPNVHIEQDSMVTLLMEEKIAGIQRGEQERAGFRVQIYSSNHPQRGKSEALKLEQRVRQELSVPVYVIYATPSWKVRLGDFLTEAEAADFRDAFKQLFPDLADYTYIVRDQVKIR
ncbi:MAG: SPOR domain-containing protein [Paludibacteraceae bacterium]|nr:SPOR domain-containing protein [Paludibacteraceae bacterium]